MDNSNKNNQPLVQEQTFWEAFKKAFCDAFQKQMTKWVKIKIGASLALVVALGGFVAFVGVGVEQHSYKAQIIFIEETSEHSTLNYKKWLARKVKRSMRVTFVIMEGPFKGKELGIVLYDEKNIKNFQEGDMVMVDAGQGRISWFTTTSNLRPLDE